VLDHSFKVNSVGSVYGFDRFVRYKEMFVEHF